MLAHLRNSKKTVGLKQSLKAIENGEAKTIIIARDADERIIKEIKAKCDENSIEVIYVDDMGKLGKACNIDVGASVVCVLE